MTWGVPIDFVPVQIMSSAWGLIIGIGVCERRALRQPVVAALCTARILGMQMFCLHHNHQTRNIDKAGRMEHFGSWQRL